MAALLEFTPSGLSYVLYKLSDEQKYRSFVIPKKSGGDRIIHAPNSRLSLVQKRLADYLYDCVLDIQKQKKNFWKSSHGFQKQKTIISNASAHKRKRYVFNIDLEDFFGAINFGRVRGFFIRDRNFSLEPSVATLLAQIACFENKLPQGSPCSPVISNLIGNILDLRLIALAKQHNCFYTRYADDLTFSTNEPIFPSQIAQELGHGNWAVGHKLLGEIQKSGFRINQQKTRMALKRSRQTVTGLVVNNKPNVSREYYRNARSMCHSLFSTGQYRRPDDKEETLTDNLNPLQGTLAHIYFVKARRDRSTQFNKTAEQKGEFQSPAAMKSLYQKFLYYKYFVRPPAPLVITEGVSDITYLRCAIRALGNEFPTLLGEGEEANKLNINFLNPSITTRDIINLGHGTAGQANLVSRYENITKNFSHRPMDHPVIVLCDNDDGPKTVFKNASKQFGSTINTQTTESFYPLVQNLYLIKVPEHKSGEKTEIESLFSEETRKTMIDGKPFDPKKDHGDEKSYGKVIFAEKVIHQNASNIDFSGFKELLERISSCVSFHSKITSAKNSEQSGSNTA